MLQEFKQQLTEQQESRPMPLFMDLKRLNENENDALELEEPFSEEVFNALRDMNGDKEPCTDGYTMAFRVFNWQLVKDEVLGFFKEFHENENFVRSMNSTFVVLIPKKETLEELKDSAQ